MRILRKIFRFTLWPFRFWRLALAGALLLAAAQVIADQVLLRGLAAQAEQIRREGRPVSFADLKLPEYTTIDNAHAVYEQVFDMIKNARDEAAWEPHSLLSARYVPTNPEVPRTNDDPLSEEERTRLCVYLQKVQPASDLLRTSRDCHVCIIPDVWGEINAIGGDGKEHAFVLPSLSRMRQLARLAAAKGLWECQQGNMDGGFDWFALGLNIANNHKAFPTLLGALNRISCMATVFGAVQTALYEGDIPAALPTSFAAEMRECLSRDVYSRTFECERLYSNEMSVRMGFRAWRVARPIYSLNQLKINESYLQLSDIFRNGDFPAQEAKLRELQEWSDNASGIHMMTKILVPAVLRSVESMRRIMVSSGMCETAIKLKLYRQKNGAYPESLSELAQPLPADPFSGRDFQYKREGEGFRLISAGKKVVVEGKKKVETSFAWCAVR